MEHSGKMADILCMIPEPERSKIFSECLMKICGAYKSLEDDTYKKEWDLAELSRKSMNMVIGGEQLGERFSKQKATISNLEMKIQDIEKGTYDSSVFIEIPNYSQKKAAAMTGTPSFYSDDFYTDRHGYRMCVGVYLYGDGVGKGTHVSVFFAIKKGDYDNYLSWPFQHRVTFILRNQDNKAPRRYMLMPDPLSPAFQKPMEDMNIPSGNPMFVPHSVIENPEEGFMRNNTIAIEVIVDPPDHA